MDKIVDLINSYNTEMTRTYDNKIAVLRGAILQCHPVPYGSGASVPGGNDPEILTMPLHTCGARLNCGMPNSCPEMEVEETHNLEKDGDE